MCARSGKTILCVIGTRPEAIKMAPLIRALKECRWACCRVLKSGQHRELVDPMLDFFGIEPDVDLDLMQPGQAPGELTRRILGALRDALAVLRPELVLAQGDTSTVLATALACCGHRIPFGHVEAGLRSHRLDAPFPEEANRVIAGHLSTMHFAPTAGARANLIREGIRAETIHVTGNTVIDALLAAAQRDVPIGTDLDPAKRLVLVTVHRRESFGEPIRRICTAIARLHSAFPDVEFLWPVHPNPAIQPVVRALLEGLPRVHLAEPLHYGAFVAAMKRATLILTDSGGIQEEGPALGVPILVLRNESERPEALACGVAKLAGHDEGLIVAETARLLADRAARRAMATGFSPYGDGHAAERIASIVGHYLGVVPLLAAAG
jgi:UDP-N-acetylglucosamine 2-epimerase (non-hydrolysing)